ncbi:MAG: FMN-binding protein [Candidatus Omnitrophica bacterium]|nr:FMN-binding protein [Candidatus Omnitrophota bacterium]
MCKRAVFSAAIVFCLSILLFGNCYAVQLLSQEEALKKVFGSDVKILTENKDLVEPKLAKVTEKLGGSLICTQKGARLEGCEIKTNFDFYFAQKDGKKTGVAIIDSEPGKWGPVGFIIAMDLQGTVTRVEVLSYEEKRGQPIARHSFLSQFEGKTSKSPLQVDKDITGISGATISSRSAVFAVKKATVLYEELYLNK